MILCATHSCSAEVVKSPRLVASIKTILARVSGTSRKKDPGRKDQRRKARKVKGGTRLCAPVKTRSGKKGKAGKEDSPVRSSSNEAVAVDKDIGSKSTAGVSEDDSNEGVAGPRRSTRSAKRKDTPPELPKKTRSRSADTAGGRATVEKAAPYSTTTRRRSKSVGDVAPQQEGEVRGGSRDESDRGQPLCMRGSTTEELKTHTCVEELGLEEQVEEEWSDEDCDFDDNLTYHEDSLSVMRGLVTTPLGKDIKVWVTTDSGSMTMLMQESYARKLKLQRRNIPLEKHFSINSPGGGGDEIREYVVLPLRITCKRESKPEEAYDECEAVEETITVQMKFGLCESLPVPILWGGKQMRRYGLLDYHSVKTLSLKVKGVRFITPSTSWLGATVEMGEEVDGKARKAYQPFLPSRERLANMVMGGRDTINMPAILYPGRDNVVRVGRHNARIDEGYNEVLVTNLDEVAATYGEWVVPIECVTNGEAFIIVRNNADQPIRLTPGALKLSIRPAVTLPRILSPREVLQSPSPNKQQAAAGKVMATTVPSMSGQDDVSLPDMVDDDSDSEDEEERGAPTPSRVLATLTEHLDSSEAAVSRSNPHRFLTWNCNGLSTRMKKGELQGRFYSQVAELCPDVISIQEVKLECDEGFHSEVKKGSEDETHWEAFMTPLRGEYDAYLSLSSTKYGGQAVLVRKTVLGAPRVTYNMGDAGGHYKSGRFIKLEWPDLVVRSVYVPFNGAGKVTHHERRREWDEQLKVELEDPGPTGKARILLGDLNVAYRDQDISYAPKFWKSQGDQTVPEGDRGFGGTTENERARFKDIVVEAGLADTFTVPLDPDSSPRWTFRGEGRFHGKGMKLDYVLADDSVVLSGGIESSEILSGVWARDGFMGSDHAPLMCVLHPRWQIKRANLLAYYAAWAPVEEKRQLSCMFANTAAEKSLPKVVSAKAREEKAWQKGLNAPRPDAFPEQLWRYVEPAQRLLVQGRYSLFKSRSYLDECLAAILTKLDVQPREELHIPPWFTQQEGEQALQEKFLRAQALANPHIYFFPDPDEVAMAKDVVADVVTTNERPFKCRPRKLSVVQQAFLQAKTNIMLRMKQLEEANSEWCHGLVLVAYEERIQAFMAKHGDVATKLMFESEHEQEVATFFRLCVDLRMLNARTVPDRFPLPRIDDLLESIPRSCGRYSISDIADAFFKCELNKADRHKTAFRTHDKHLQFAVLPQGFINSPSVFCRLIARTFEGVSRERFSAYIDDVLNHSDDFQIHLDTQQDLYDRLDRAGLTLKLSKTHLNYERVKFLGHILTKEGRLPDPEAVEAILEWSNPTTTKEVRSFLGSTLYYREYIHDYSDMAMPLYDLIRKGVVVAAEWKDELHGVACRRIKEALTSKPVLMQVDNTKPFRLKVDACRVGRGIGCILEQQNADGKWQPVSYYSCSLSKEERNYSATELECKALHDCILHYAVYLKYIPHFEVFSDHNALRYMVNSDHSTTNGRLMRYLLNLQGFNFAIYYRRGTENCDADAVSRLLRASDKPLYLSEDDLNNESGIISKSMLERARALDRRNEKLAKAAKQLLSKLDKQNLTEMSLLNDHILAEGVENLESESGRVRFFENLKAHGLQCTRETLDTTLESMREDKGGATAAGEHDEAKDLPIIVAMVNFIGNNVGLSCDSPLEDKGQPLCMRGSLTDRGDENDYEDWLVGQDTQDEGLMCGSCIVDTEESSEDGERILCRANTNCDEDEVVAGLEDTREYRETPVDISAGNKVLAAYGAACAYSAYEVPHRLACLISTVERSVENDDWGQLVNHAYISRPVQTLPSYKILSALRQKIDTRVNSYAGKVFTLASSTSSYAMRQRKKVDYRDDGRNITHPNEKRYPGKPLVAPINEKLAKRNKLGSGKVVVKESLIPGDTGWGLFAVKPIGKGVIVCSYEGEIVPPEHLLSGHGNKDYVIEAIKNHRTQERICMDSPDPASCYGRYAQDPINEDLVNAKIIWRKGQMVVVATDHIAPGDEVYVHYGLEYWEERLHFLDEESRKRIEPRILKMRKSAAGYVKGVSFHGEVTVAEFEELDSPDMLPENVLEDGEPLLAPAVAYQHRMDSYQLQEGGSTPEKEQLELDQALLDELAYENVDECEELADKVQFLVGRKFEDEGRLYEVMQVRYDPEFEKVIGFRRPMSGKTPHGHDGSAFCVYGKEGLYELTERYLLHHPEERDCVVWPTDHVGWAQAQSEDPELGMIMRKITDQGGGPIKEGRHKLALKDTGLLIRLVEDLRKGSLEQAMVPSSLIRSTLRLHHEGYGHMGANRMLETIRLRYFWSKMDQDISEHTGKCINCKLRKSYQRRPKVPIMKYDDTARPLDRVHVDLTGPLPLTRLKNRYIMVIKDYLTKYVWLIPLKTKSAMEVAEAFVGEFVCQAGVPGRLVSDRGNEFVNQLLTNVSKIMGINRISTTPYNPRADGFVENHNKTLKDQLFHLVDNLKQDDWDVYLPTVQLQYNTTVSLATGYTPMLLMTGREARMPSLNHLESEKQRLLLDKVNNAYVLKMIETMRGYQDFALSQTDKNKERFNVRVRQPLEFVEYEVGQQFMRVRRPISKFKSADEKEAWKITAKLLERFEGPYRVTAKVNPVLYEAEIDGKTVRVHAVNMKPF